LHFASYLRHLTPPSLSGYLAAHMRLINKLAKTCANREAAQQLHADLFESGYDKVVLVSRARDYAQMQKG
jgi:hypothetical protein